MKKMICVLGLGVLATLQAFASDPVSDAFKNCVNANAAVSVGTEDGVATGKVTLSKVSVDGTDSTVLQLSCTGPAAEALFATVGRFSTEQDRVWSTGNRVLTRTFGSLSVASQCNRRIRNADGTEANYYWCNIMIDIVGSMLKAIDLN